MSGGASLRQEEGRMSFAHADPNLFSIFIFTDDSDDLAFSFIHMFGLAFSLLIRIHFPPDTRRSSQNDSSTHM